MKTKKSRNTKQVTDNNAAYRLSRELNEDLLCDLNCASTAMQKKQQHKLRLIPAVWKLNNKIDHLY